MESVKLLVGIVALTVVLANSCASRETAFQASSQSSTNIKEETKSGSAPKEVWENVWEKVLSQARKEGSVVVIGTLGNESTTPLRLAFKEKYGIGAEFISGRGGEITQKILQERKAGLYLVDIYMGGATTPITGLKPSKVFDPLELAMILPEVTDARKWLNGKMEFVDQERTIFPYSVSAQTSLAINTNLVKPDEIKYNRDILTPRWKGKIVLYDPTAPGMGQAWFGLTSAIFSMDYMRELAKQEPVITRDIRLQVEWLSQGKFPVAIAIQPDMLSIFMREGAPVKRLLLNDGHWKTGATSHIGLINQAPHPNAARLFINWFLGKEAQTLDSKIALLPSARLDVPTDHVDPVTVIQPGVDYFNVNTEDFILTAPERMKVAQGIFGQLMR